MYCGKAQGRGDSHLNTMRDESTASCFTLSPYMKTLRIFDSEEELFQKKKKEEYLEETLTGTRLDEEKYVL